MSKALIGLKFDPKYVRTFHNKLLPTVGVIKKKAPATDQSGPMWGRVIIYDEKIYKDPKTGRYSGHISALYRWSNRNGCIIMQTEYIKDIPASNLKSVREDISKKLSQIWRYAPTDQLWTKRPADQKFE